MIASIVEGRIRIRANRLKSRKTAENIKRKVEELPGVTSVRTNPRACSIVVHYDSEEVDTVSLEDQVVEICTPKSNGNNKNGNGLSKRFHQATKVGMMTTLATSLAYGYAGNKKQHLGYGTAFVAFAGLHMLKYSNRLLR